MARCPVVPLRGLIDEKKHLLGNWSHNSANERRGKSGESFNTLGSLTRKKPTKSEKGPLNNTGKRREKKLY